MLLTVLDRIVLMQILPQEGDITLLRVAKEAATSIGFTGEELAYLKLKQDGDQVSWDRSKDSPKEIPLGPAVLGTIRDTFKDLSNRKKLKLQYLDLYERVMKEEKP